MNIKTWCGKDAKWDRQTFNAKVIQTGAICIHFATLFFCSYFHTHTFAFMGSDRPGAVTETIHNTHNLHIVEKKIEMYVR